MDVYTSYWMIAKPTIWGFVVVERIPRAAVVFKNDWNKRSCIHTHTHAHDTHIVYKINESSLHHCVVSRSHNLSALRYKDTYNRTAKFYFQTFRCNWSVSIPCNLKILYSYQRYNNYLSILYRVKDWAENSVMFNIWSLYV